MVSDRSEIRGLEFDDLGLAEADAKRRGTWLWKRRADAPAGLAPYMTGEAVPADHYRAVKDFGDKEVCS